MHRKNDSKAEIMNFTGNISNVFTSIPKLISLSHFTNYICNNFRIIDLLKLCLNRIYK
ncbi:hypothetical protein FLAT13_00268 [Flavobacterium salmonis]|jgi:hypothetical protein|uniref:Uncharacterized protein n=1 Tax=Flavobacterium salmonis TaxID=2654844 RepID=A0A6V6YN08_9FLAO|nr:hypothetical protein FLAT13_00268 [Flavobacterium salmonis]